MGEVELRTLARPLPTYCCPHAKMTQAPLALRNDWTKSILQVAASFGNLPPLNASTTHRNAAAMETRAAINVNGGISLTATLRNKYDAPQSTAKRHSNAYSFQSLDSIGVITA